MIVSIPHSLDLHQTGIQLLVDSAEIHPHCQDPTTTDHCNILLEEPLVGDSVYVFDRL